MMKKLTSKKVVSMLVVALFMFFFAGTAVSQEAPGSEVNKMVTTSDINPDMETVTVVEEMNKMAGTISDIKPEMGKVTVVEEESGKTIILIAGSDVDLKNFNVGDTVVAEYSNDMVIKSINKQTV